MTALALYCSTCVSILSCSSFGRKNINNLGSLQTKNSIPLFKLVQLFQFVDDDAVVTTNKHEAQLLLSIFTKWCQWSNMLIRVDECLTVGIKMFSSIRTNLFVNNKTVPTFKSGNSFKYLDRYFNFEMGNNVHKENLQSTLPDLLKSIDSLSIQLKNRQLLYQRYILSKLSWQFTDANFAKTGVIENLDTLTIRFIRQ